MAKNIFVSFANKNCSVIRYYDDIEELYDLIKDDMVFCRYCLAIESGKVVFEFNRKVNAPIKNRKSFNTAFVRNVTKRDIALVKRAFSRRLINCNADNISIMMKDAEKNGTI